MSLREEMWKYEQITGESAEHVPIINLGAFLDGYEMGLKALDQRWIPVSERLPETRDEVLVFLANGQMTIASYNDHVLPFFDKSIGWQVDIKRFVFYFCSDDVIAWMPLPKPYKEGVADE